MKSHRILILAFFAITLISCGGAEERKAVYMEKAKSSIESGDLDKARIELKNVLQIDPKDGEAYYQLGKVYEQQNELRKAYSNYLKAEELAPDLLENHARLGQFYLILMKDIDKAQEKMDLILSKDSNNSDGLLLKASVMVRNKNTDEAVELTRKIIAQDPDHLESVIFLASIYIKDKKGAEAISVLDTALKNNQNNQKLNKLLVSVLVAEKKYDRAEIMYKDFLERNPDNAHSYNNLAGLYFQTNDKVKAEEILRDSIKNKPDDEGRILTLIKYINNEEGKIEAIKELSVHISENKGLGQLRTVQAELYMLNGDKELAINVYKKSIVDFSEEVTGITARIALASIYANDKEFDKAAEVIEDALSISPNNPQVNYLRAKLAVRDKDYEQAIISLRIVTKEMPQNIEAFILLAAVYQQDGKKEQANSALNNAYENNKINAAGLLKLAQYHMSRDIQKAEKIIDSYNNLKETNYAGLSIKASILNQNKKQTEAYKIAQILLDAYSDKPNGYLQSIPYYGHMKNIEGAVALLEKGYLTVKDNRKILLLLTSLQMQQSKFDIVEKRINAELVSTPEDVQLKIMLAKVYLVNKKIDAAERLLKETIVINSNIEETYLLLSNVYQSKANISAATEILIKGKTNVKASIKISLKLAVIYEVEGSYTKAINVYRDIYDIHPDNLIIINNLASMLSDHSKSKEDLEFAKVLAEKLKGKEQAAFLDTIGWVNYKLGDYQSAIETLAVAVEKSPKISVFNYHLGMAYKMAGDNAMAKTYLEKSLVDTGPSKQKNLAEAALKDL